MIEIKLSDKEVLRIERKEYEGHPYVNLQRFYKGDDNVFHYTKKRLTVPIRKWPEFLQGANKFNPDEEESPF